MLGALPAQRLYKDGLEKLVAVFIVYRGVLFWIGCRVANNEGI